MTPILPKHIWTHIRSYCSDTCYDPTPTASLIKTIFRQEDPYGIVRYAVPHDGYASTYYMVEYPTYFKKLLTRCFDGACTVCSRMRKRVIRDSYMRHLHIDSQGYYVYQRYLDPITASCGGNRTRQVDIREFLTPQLQYPSEYH